MVYCTVSLIQCVNLIIDYSTGTATQHSQEGPSQPLDPRFIKGVVCCKILVLACILLVLFGNKMCPIYNSNQAFELKGTHFITTLL